MSAVLLLGVPGQLKTVLDRLTATRAGNLDNINSTRMAKIDTINTRVDVASSSLATAANLSSMQSDVTTIKTTTAATNTSANTLTTRLSATRAGYIDLIPDLPGGASISGLIGTPPTSLAGVALATGTTPAILATHSHLLDATDNANDTNWVTAGSITGKGVIQHLSIFTEFSTATYQMGIRVTIDGVVVYEKDRSFTLGVNKEELLVLVGGFSKGDGYADHLCEMTGHLPFRSSVLVETRATAALHRGALIGGYLL